MVFYDDESMPDLIGKEGRPVFWKHYQEILGAVLVGIAVFFLVSIAAYVPSDYSSLIDHGSIGNLLGPVGAWVSHIVRSFCGSASYGFVIVLAVPGIYLIRSNWVGNITEKSICILLVTVSFSSVMSLFMGPVPQLSGGYAGASISSLCVALMGRTASYLILSMITLMMTVITVILFLSPEREQYKTTARFSGMFRKFLGSKKQNESMEPRRNDRRFPWITKKRIIVYETEKRDSPFNAVPLMTLPDRTINRDYALIPDETGGSEQLLLDIPSDTIGAGTDNPDVILRDDQYMIDTEAGSETDDEDAADDEIISREIIITDDSGVIEETCESVDTETIKDEIDDNPELQRPLMNASSTPPDDYNERVFDSISINEEYIIPTSYLTSSKPLDTESWKKEIHRNSILLKNTLAEFGIEADVVNVNRGPVITLYEMQIAPGIKVNRIVGLADDIAMALAAQRVRIVAPIPGKSAIGVEIPNLYRETVTLGDIVKSEEFKKYEGSLVVALGKDILGKPVMLDLKRLPHLLIAGTTGSGKSVCVNSIITSLIYNYEPNYLRFILVDPKMVELQLYNGLPHLLTPVIVDPQVAPMVLKWTMHEMERRYCLLSAINTRDIERYNEKVAHQKKGSEQLPYIVVIIDEMADLMMSSKEVEGYITRIAQKSRAVGIHLVVATQRPSVDIITGLIKANFPARIAFQVAQKTDSRTIIDQNGAEKLLGRGDMLYQSPTSSFPMRIQGGFISEEEIEKIATHLCRMGKPSYIDIEESLLAEEESKEFDENADELFQEALKIIEETKKASASYLQRRLSIGYNRAARIIEQMEDLGYIGPQIGSKPREVFV